MPETPPYFGRSPHARVWTRRYGIAALLTLTGAVSSALLYPKLHLAGALLPPLLAVVVIGWYCGILAALFSEICGTILVFGFIARPSPAQTGEPAIFWLLSFLLVGTLLLLSAANLRWAHHLRRSTEHLEMIAHATHDSLWEWDLKTDHVWRGGNLEGIFGYSEQDVRSDLTWWRERLHPEDAEHVLTSLREAIEGGETRWSEEYRFRRKDGSYVPVADHGFVVRTRSGKAIRMIGGMTDVSERRRAEEQLVHNAFHDVLTGLPNRELFLDRLERATALRRYHGGGVVAILFVDIDRFKIINDSLGHAVGDRLLAAIGNRLRSCLRQGDTAARFGGDEFTLLLDCVGKRHDAILVAERIQETMAMPFDLGDHQVTVTASIGIAFAESDQPEEVLRHADIAMYRAKARGKARYEVFEPSLDVRAMNLLQLENDLRQALQNRSFRLYYQPIVSLLTGRIVSFEALLRWEHPRRGILLPADFLPVAEDAGMAVPLGQWVLRESCNRLRMWRHSSPAAASLTMSINLSGQEFVQAGLVERVRTVLNETELAGKFLVVEITENVIMESDEIVAERLRHLRDLGIRLALDDFGKGHSSLARLQEFPISILKVDSSFVRGISDGKPQILDAITALAGELKLEITAEGIETEEQFEHLRKRGAAMGQGVFFSDALAPDAAEMLLTTRQPWMSRYESVSEGQIATGFAAG